VPTWIDLGSPAFRTDWTDLDPRDSPRGERIPEGRRCDECFEPVPPRRPRPGRYFFCSPTCRSRFRSRLWRKRHRDATAAAQRAWYEAHGEEIKQKARDRRRAARSSADHG
jgi:hypothetical protein